MKTFAVYISANALYSAVEVTDLSASNIDQIVRGNWFGVSANNKKEAIKKAIAEGFKG